MKRTATIKRKTSETDIAVTLNIDGSGTYCIDTPAPFLNHMLELTAKHGLFDLTIKAQGDTQIDLHHTVEDTGICLGEAVHKALGSKRTIRRYGDKTVPMDESLAQVAMDISGRPFLSFNVPPLRAKNAAFDLELVEEFFHAFVNNSGITLHINVLRGKNYHHIIEAVFKAFARALDEATQVDKRVRGVPSTKGTL
jgi:imidazoleglycerol-phosphate dehydratase